ncbi:MAG: ATP-binding cassette domain-containing protein [Armatimonadota bacterium]|nr:ATP-binding cassette domain-containing protein [Armatimonadota bacterium]
MTQEAKSVVIEPRAAPHDERRLADAVVRTVALTRRYGHLVAADAVSIAVAPRQIFGLLGPNGAGKSTVVKMLTTLLPPTAGDAWVAGFHVAREPAAVRRSIGYVPQMLSADGALTGYENLLLSARLYSVPGAERAGRIEEALGLMGLREVAHDVVRSYSGGMVRRLEVAQGMLHHPVVLFMDEPTVGLDPVARQSLWEHVRRLRDLLGMTVFITTHYMDEADEWCDRVAILHHGRVVAVGSPLELKAQAGAGATLDDVFIHLTESGIEPEDGGYREVLRTRRTARRLG